MQPLDLVRLTPLMERSMGKPEITIGLIDGPVLMSHPDLVRQNTRELPGAVGAVCSQPSSAACTHGTLVAGILSARRGSAAPSICPACTLLIRSIFPERDARDGHMPNAASAELAGAIFDAVNAGARVINLSAALAQPSSRRERDVEEALSYAARRGVITVAAAGNQGTLGSSAITRHPAVIPVVSCNLDGRPLADSNLGKSIGRQGLSAPGLNIVSIGTDGRARSFSGTSAAAPFVTGAIALLWSDFPDASPRQLRLALTRAGGGYQRTVVPPLLDAWKAHQVLALRRPS